MILLLFMRRADEWQVTRSCRCIAVDNSLWQSPPIGAGPRLNGAFILAQLPQLAASRENKSVLGRMHKIIAALTTDAGKFGATGFPAAATAPDRGPIRALARYSACRSNSWLWLRAWPARSVHDHKVIALHARSF
jgi:hypothetical protein